MRNLVIFSLYLLASCSATSQPAQKIISGYYPAWRWYDRDKLVKPSTINYELYDIINYAFLDLRPNGTLRLNDPWADKNLLLGPINSAAAPAGYDRSDDLGNPKYHQPGQRFSDFAHRRKTRFVVSIGGWTHSENFSAVAADPAKRNQFALQCAQIVQLYNLDGIDIDWEYPGYLERGGSAADKQNFTLLLRQVRSALDALERKLHRELILSIACSAAPARMDGIDWSQVKGLVDGITLMAYSFYGHWDPVSNHNAPLFPPANATQPGFSCSEAVQNLLEHGVPAAKINLGLAFFGRTQLTAGDAGLHVQGLGRPDSLAFPRNGASPQYYLIAERLSQGIYNYGWDGAAQAPYLYGKPGIRSFVSFDDEKSIALKAEFVRCRQLHGVAIWDITADYLETAPGSGVIAGNPLAAAVKRVFSNPNAPTPDILANATVCVYPNPTPNGYLQVFTNANDSVPTSLALFDTNGQQLHATRYANALHRLDLRALPAGPYLVQVRRGTAAPVLVRVIKK